MDFFRSILSEPDPDPTSPPPEPEAAGSTSSPSAVGRGGEEGAGWGFGGLLKTLTSQSETVLETYRRDLAEFSTGLRRETEAIRDAAARAARDLPSSAHALDGLAGIVAHGKDALLQATAAAGASSAASDADSEPNSAASGQRRYSRFEAQLLALQSDPATFTSDPDDAEDFAAWKAGFDMEERKEQIETLCYDSDVLEGMVETLVPDAVESEVFWGRYFYRVHKLKQQEDARAKLVKRAISQEEEDLSWEVDDEDVEEQEKDEEDVKGEGIKQEEVKQEIKHEEEQSKDEVVEDVGALEKEAKNAEAYQPAVFSSCMVVVDEEKETKEEALESNVESSGDKKGVTEEPHASVGDGAVKEGGKHETSESSKDSDYSMVSSQRAAVEEEDLEWDEIEDLGENDEKKPGTQSSSPALKEELRKRLIIAEDDEALSWDIEDDDEKA